MADEELGTASVVIVLDDSGTDASLDRLSDRIERALAEGARDGARRMQRQLNLAIAKINPLRIEIAADTTRFRATLNELNNLGSTSIRVRPAVDPARFRRELQRAVAGVYVRIPVRPDFQEFDAAIRAHRPPPMDVRVRPQVESRTLQKSLKGISSAISKLGGIAGITLAIGGLGIAAAGAAAAVGGLAAALAPTIGIIAAAPAAIFGMVAAMGALKIALSGVGDAFGAALGDDAEKFEKSLENLSPAAQAAAREVRALKPRFDELKTTVQDSFFKRFQGDLTRTAKALQGPLTKGLSDIASGWGRAARNALGYIQGARGVSDIQAILKASSQAVGGLSEGTNKLTAGLLQAGAAVSKAFGAEFAGGLNAALQRFGTFLQTAAGDGRLVAWVNDALDALAQLGDILGNIGGILSGVFEASGDAGANFLDNLQRITQTFETFVKSVEGQQALSNIFKAVGAVAAQLGPIFTSIVKTIGQIAPALMPLFNAIGPAITSVISALGPAIQALMPGITAVVNAIVSALGSIVSSGVLEQIGAAFSEVLKAVSPLIPLIAQLVTAFAQALAPAISAIAKALAPVIKAFADALAPVLPVLVKAVQALITALGPLIAMIGQTLAGVITALAPLLLTIAEAFASIVAAVAPLIAQLIDGLAPIINAIAPIVSRLVSAIAPLITQLVAALLPVLPPIIDAFLAILAALVPLIEPVVKLVEALAPLVELIIKAIAPVLELQAGFLSMAVIEVVVPIIEGMVKALIVVIEVVTKAIDDIVAFGRIVESAFSSLKVNGITSIGELSSRIIAYFAGLINKVLLAVGLWVQDMQTKIGQLRDGVVQRVRDMINDVVNFFVTLPGRAKAALNSLGNSLGSAVGEAGEQLQDRVRKLVNDAVQAIKELPSKARSALGGLGGLLVGAGQDLIQGLINGVRSKAGEIASSAASVVSGAVAAAKRALDIRSPSKVFIQIGKFVGQGFINGLTASEESIKRTADQLVKLVIDAFKGKGQKTKLDDFLITSVRSTQRELEALVGKREKLAERIKEANEFAAQTTQQALSAFDLGSQFDKVTKQIEERNAKLREIQSRNPRARLPFIARRDNTVDELISSVQASAARVARFNRQITDLAKRGLRKDLIAQLIGLGPEAGADLAQQLSKATNAQLKQLNKAQADLAAAANKFGKDSADKMFDAGTEAAKGFLAGLKAQKKSIEDLMITIAKGLTAAIKKALGIRSPSKVMRSIGVDTGRGLVNGIRSMDRAVAGASSTLAATAVRGAVSPVGALSSPFGYQAANRTSQAATAAATGRYGAAQDVTVNNNIVINEVGNAEATAQRVINRLALTAGTI